MRYAALIFLAAFVFAADIPKWEPVKALGYEWDVPSAAEWRAEPNLLEMLKIGPAKPEPRRPMQYALARTKPFHKVTLGNGAIQGVPRGGQSIPTGRLW